MVLLWHTTGPRHALILLAAAMAVVADRPLADLIGTTEAFATPGGLPSGHGLFAASSFGAIAHLGRRDVATARLVSRC